MPANVVKSKHDEKMWGQAKSAAEKAGKSGDWKYVMGTFEHMKHKTGSKPVEPKSESKRDPHGEAGESAAEHKKEMLVLAARARMKGKG